VSFDGGTTWTSVVIPGLTLVSGGTYQRASDPWVSFDPNGIVYASSLLLNQDENPNAIVVSKSLDGGLTWGTPATLRADSAPILNDKDAITADPTAPGDVYAVWDRVVPLGGGSFVGPTWLARSTDGGSSWETAHAIYDPGLNFQTLGNQIVVLPSGVLVDIFEIPQAGVIAAIRSFDKGVTWSTPSPVSSNAQSDFTIQTLDVFDPDNGQNERTGGALPEVAVGPNGDLYVVWEDARFSGLQHNSIGFATSSDGGFTWSTPIQINKTPTNIPSADQQAFTPDIAVAADGTIAVTYYDFRNNTPAPGALADSWVVRSHGGYTDPANWGDESRLTDTSFDTEKAPNAGGYFLGDYQGLAAAGSGFVAIFSQTHGNDPASIFASSFGTTSSLASVADAGFESPSVGAGNFQYDPTGADWTFAGSAGISGNDSGFTAGNPPAPQGSQVAFLQGPGSFSQAVSGWSAGSYVISFDAAQRGNFQASQQDFAVLVDGAVVGTFTPSGTSYQGYTTAPFTVVAGVHTITFQGLDSVGGDNTALIDSVAVALYALTANQSLSSPNGQFQLIMQGDGNLVEYGPGGQVIWDSATSDNPGAYAIMQGDGNLVVYSPAGTALWNSGTYGNPGAYFQLQDNGNAVINRADGTALWYGNSSALPGRVLTAGQAIYAPNGQYQLIMQGDGNLVEYGPGGRAVWNSVTYGNPGAYAVMQGDGNLVVYSPAGTALWNSRTYGHPGAYLVLDDGGALEIVDQGTVIWSV
jgi:hypothetical protein